MIEAFEFTDEGRTFQCSVSQASGQRTDAWWWFHVSSERDQRFAPFRADNTDTADDVRRRVVAFYAALLETRARPYAKHWSRGRQAPAAAVPADQTALPASA